MEESLAADLRGRTRIRGNQKGQWISLTSSSLFIFAGFPDPRVSA